LLDKHKLIARQGNDKAIRGLDKKFKEKPSLYIHLQDVWFMFFELHNRRQSGFAPNPISIESIAGWFRLNDISKDLQYRLYKLITAMDNCWLGHMNEKNK